MFVVSSSSFFPGSTLDGEANQPNRDKKLHWKTRSRGDIAKLVGTTRPSKRNRAHSTIQLG